MLSKTSDKLLLGTRKGLLTFSRQNGKWSLVSESHQAIPVSYADVDPRSGHWWACLDHGHWGNKLHRSLDEGKSWQELAAPKYPEGEEIKDGVPASLSYLWVFAPGGADQPQRVYLGTIPGGLFSSDDGGENFELVRGLWDHPSRKSHWFGGGYDHPGIHSILVDPADSSHLLVGISCAGVFETVDGGQSWNARNRGLKAEFLPDDQAEYGHDPHRLDVCGGDFRAMWQQNHCGIFRSTDGAVNWEMVSQEGGPAHFGFALAVHPRRGDTAWVIPAKSDEKRVAIERSLCVCRTEDGGKSWTALRQGLPQHDCYDIVYRHGLDGCGDRLAFGTTTGNLYLSDDGGESWQALAHHLPPIYSVRFADL